jgi:homoserine O-acetyltransferase
VTSAYYSQEVHGPFETHELGDFELEQGGKIRSLKLAYATFGTLSPEKDNAILFPTWFSGSNKILELGYVGPGRALDPSKYFIILVNQIGNGLSSAPHNTKPPFNAARFPVVHIGDDVRAQHKLITENLGSSNSPSPLASRWERNRPMIGPSVSRTWSNAPRRSPGTAKGYG